MVYFTVEMCLNMVSVIDALVHHYQQNKEEI